MNNDSEADFAARHYQWLKVAIDHADGFCGRRPDLIITIKLGRNWLIVDGRVLSAGQNLFSHVSWTEFEKAKSNVLIEHINRVAMKLQPYAVDVIAKEPN